MKIGLDPDGQVLRILAPQSGKEGVGRAQFLRVVKAAALTVAKRESGDRFGGHHVRCVRLDEEAVGRAGPGGLAHAPAPWVGRVGRKGNVTAKVQQLEKHLPGAPESVNQKSLTGQPGGLQDILDSIWEGNAEGTQTPPEPAAEPTASGGERGGRSAFQFMKEIEATVDHYVRPRLQAEGGDVDVVDIKDFLVYCRLKGACAGCPGAATTLKLMVERILKEQVDEKVKIIAV